MTKPSELRIKLECPNCGSKNIYDGKQCRRCGYRGEREAFVVKDKGAGA